MWRLTSLLLLTLSAAQAIRPGDAAPNFTLRTGAGQTVTLSELRGQPVVLTFWATWCSVCKEELPELNREAARLNLKNMFALSATDAPKGALAYFAGGKLNAITPLVDAPQGVGANTAAKVAKAYRVIGQPVAVFIDAEGQVAAVHAGYLPTEQFALYLKQIRAK